MALRQIGTNSTTSLVALPAWSAALLAADLANIANGITGDMNFGAVLGQVASATKAVLATGSTHSNTTLDTLVATGGPPLSQIQVGDKVLGVGIVPGTYVAAIPSASSVTLSQAATATTAGVRIGFVRATPGGGGSHLSRNGLLVVPGGRGILKLLPGDIVALDNLGFPYLIPGNAISYAGSLWTLT